MAICIGAIAFLGGGPASAQEATPTPVVCDVEPRPADFLVTLLAQPEPEATPQPLTGVPEGSDEVDLETRAAVIAVVDTLVACVNDGELLRSFALFEDDYLRRVIDPEGLMTDSVAAELSDSFATPVAVPETEATTIEAILLVRRLPDGSVAVVFRSRGGAGRDPGDVQVDMFIMRQIEGEWIIVDGLTNLDPASIPAV